MSDSSGGHGEGAAEWRFEALHDGSHATTDTARSMVRVVNGRIPVLTGVAEYTTALACRFARDAEKIGVDGLMVLPAMVYKSGPARDDRRTSAPWRAPATCRSWSTTTRPPTTSTSRRRCSPSWPTSRSSSAIKESSDNVRRITDLINLVGDRYMLFCGVDDLVLESVLLGAAAGSPAWSTPSPTRTARSGTWRPPASGTRRAKLYRWYTPLLHLDTKSSWCSTSSWRWPETGLGTEMVRAPRLPLAGAERERDPGIIRKAIAHRPALAAAAIR